MAEVHGSGTASIEISGEAKPSLSMRAYFSRKYFRAALRSADIVKLIEERYLNGRASYATVKDRHEMSAITAIVAAVASLEARIAELLQDVDQGHRIGCAGLSEDQITRLKAFKEPRSKSGIPQILVRCQKIYTVLGLVPPEFESTLWTNVKEVVYLRNHLIHNEPENHRYLDPGEKPAEGSLEARIGPFFATSALAPGKEQPFFPDRCLGAGCAFWAIKTIYDFLSEFESAVGLSHGFPLPTINSR